MKGGFESLSERERETLRLLGRGHEAKSIAAALNLSVHTVNERLRAARRKLGVSSSREAARLLRAHEAVRMPPENSGYKEIGVVLGEGDDAHSAPVHPGAAGARRRLIPIAIGGIMLIGLLSVLVTMTAGSGDAPDAPVEGRPAHPTSPIPALFAAGDYPAAALAQKVQGSTAYRIRVNAAGRVEECEIERSSGSAALDSTTCRVIRSRARFYPAVNAEGRAVASVQTGTIEWKVQ